MFTVSVTITGDDKALNQLQHLKEILGGFDPELQAAGDYLVDFLTNEVFDSQGSVYGSPWVPLSEPYASYKSKRWGATQILVASGKMRASWVLYTATDYLIVKNEAQNKYGEYYAGGHQTGAGYLPQRMLMDFDDTRLRRIQDIIVSSLNNRIRSL